MPLSQQQRQKINPAPPLPPTTTTATAGRERYVCYMSEKVFSMEQLGT
jgi:hypothetical protein